MADPWRHSLLAFLASFVFTATPGKAGEVIKSVLLRTRYDVPLPMAWGVLLVERLGDLLASWFWPWADWRCWPMPGLRRCRWRARGGDDGVREQSANLHAHLVPHGQTP